MDGVTKETRRESYLKKPNRQLKILDFLGDKEMTARQIAYGLGFSDLNAVKPRLTELMELGKVEAIGKTYDDITGRNVAIYKKGV